MGKIVTKHTLIFLNFFIKKGLIMHSELIQFGPFGYTPLLVSLRPSPLSLCMCVKNT